MIVDCDWRMDPVCMGPVLSTIMSVKNLFPLSVILMMTFQHSSPAAIGNLELLQSNVRSTERRRGTVVMVDKEIDYSGSSANVSRLLDSLLRGYDKRLRPNYSGYPVEVGVTMFVSSVSSISEANMDYTLDFYFRQHWRDSRLNFTDGEDELCISNEMLQRIWWPDTFFANAKMANFHLATTHNAFLRIKPNGWITLSLRLTVTSMCPMDLTYFPMDTQICSLEIESYAYSEKHITYKWKDGPRDSVGLDRTVQLPQFSIRGFRAKNKLEQLSTGNYSRLACEFYFVRSLGYYIIHIYVPSCLIVVLSWISFWLHRDASPARVALGITTVLTMTTILSSSNASLPKISYLKSIDFYLVTCFFMVFASLLEYACVSYLSNLRPSSRTSVLPSRDVRATATSFPPESADGGSRACARHGTRKYVTNVPIEPLATEVRLKSSCDGTVDCKLQPVTTSFSQCPTHSTDTRGRAEHRKMAASSTDKMKMNASMLLACNIDRYSRGVFPLVFTAFNVTYWIIFLNISPRPHDTDFVLIND